jgi:hypothetical protein
MLTRVIKFLFSATCTAIAALVVLFVTDPSRMPGGYQGFGLL